QHPRLLQAAVFLGGLSFFLTRNGTPLVLDAPSYDQHFARAVARHAKLLQRRELVHDIMRHRPILLVPDVRVRSLDGSATICAPAIRLEADSTSGLVSLLEH